MPFTIARRQPSLDLKKAARLAEHAMKTEIETFTFEDMEPLYKTIPTQLRVTTSSPMLSTTYQSDEEQPSPRTEDYDESGMSEYASCDSEVDDLDFDGDDEEIQFEIEDIEVSAMPTVAIAVPIQTAKPNIIDIAVLAPMAARQVPISRPLSASYARFVKVKAPSPTELRFSLPARNPVRNFSTPLRAQPSLSPPESLHSGTSPASSCLSLSNGSYDDSDALIRESDDIQRQTFLAGTEWDDSLLVPPTPTSWAAYDPFALSAPTLIKAPHYTLNIPEKQPRGWKRLGFKTKLLTTTRRTSRV